MTEDKTKYGEVAEAMVARKLKELPAEFSVIANVDIADKGRNSELDTVVVTPTGVIVVLEVKAGDLQADDRGRIVRDYSDGKQTDVAKQLGKQSAIARSRLAGLGKNLTIRSFLVLPTGHLEGEGIGIDRNRVIDCESFSDLCRIIRDCDRLPRTGAVSKDQIVEFLQNHCVVRQSLSSISDTLDVRSRELSSGLATWVPRIESPIAVVEVMAPAGAGKTQLALALLEKAAHEKRSAWYINFTRNIVQRLQRHPINQHVDFIGTFHELALDQTQATSPAELNAQDLPRYFDELAKSFVLQLQSEKYAVDCIVVDDAQDLKTEWIVALTNALSESGTFYVLSDPNIGNAQKIEFSESVKVTSDETARVPKNIARVINELGVIKGAIVSQSPFEGEVPSFRTYDGPASLLKETRAAVDEARRAGFSDDQIAILSMKGLRSSDILCSPTLGTKKYTLKQPLSEFKNGRQLFSNGSLFNDTVRRFKGLQAPCVILTEVDFEDFDDTAASLLYLGMTRASMSLTLVLSERFAQKLAARL